MVINTNKRLFQYTCLPYGVSSAPGIFQRIMENLLKDIPGVVIYIDNVLETRTDGSSHLAALEEILHHIEQVGL